MYSSFLMLPPKDYEGILAAKKKLTNAVSLFTIQVQDTAFSFVAGQFMMLSITPERGLARAFSICSSPEKKNQVEFCMKINQNSVVSEKIEQAGLKTKVYLKGPFGAFTLKPATKELVFIAGGTGIAPIRSMISTLIHQKIKENIWLFYRFKTPEECLFKEELESFARQYKNFKLILSVSNPTPEWRQETERVQSIITKYIKDPSKVECYICGPPPMVKDLVEELPDLGFVPENIHREAW